MSVFSQNIEIFYNCLKFTKDLIIMYLENLSNMFGRNIFFAMTNTYNIININPHSKKQSRKHDIISLQIMSHKF